MAELPLFALDRLSFTKVANVPLGHLVVCRGYGAAPAEVALRVRVPNARGAADDGLLSFRTQSAWGVVAAARATIADESCVNLGVPVFAVGGVSVAAAVGGRSYDARPGVLALCGPDLFVRAVFGQYGHDHGWWNVRSGEPQPCEKFLILERWRIGLMDVNGNFAPQFHYPEDFTRDAAPTSPNSQAPAL